MTRLVLDYPIQDIEQEQSEPSKTHPETWMGWEEAQITADKHINEAGKANNFVVVQPFDLHINRTQESYTYSVNSTLDFQDTTRGRTKVTFDATTGQLQQLKLPTGQYSGETVTNWLLSLHEANVFGLPYRIFVAVLGLVIAMLSITGIIIWFKKARARRIHHIRQR